MYLYYIVPIARIEIRKRSKLTNESTLVFMKGIVVLARKMHKAYQRNSKFQTIVVFWEEVLNKHSERFKWHTWCDNSGVRIESRGKRSKLTNESILVFMKGNVVIARKMHKPYQRNSKFQAIVVFREEVLNKHSERFKWHAWCDHSGSPIGLA